MCLVMSLFAVLEKFGTLLVVLEAKLSTVKSAASAASPKTRIQESRGASGRRLGWGATETARLPWIPGFWSSGRLR